MSTKSKLKRMAKLSKYLHKKYYGGRIRWILIDENRDAVDCKNCGNMANGVLTEKIGIMEYNIPYCKTHFSEIWWEKYPDYGDIVFPIQLTL